MTEDERAVFHLLEDTERVLALLRRRRWQQREEWRAMWRPITMHLHDLDAARIQAKRTHLRRAA